MNPPSSNPAPELPQLESTRSVHLLGICGTAMTALAGCLKAQGRKVTGSDGDVYPPMSDHLAAMGIALTPGYRPENIPAQVDLVVVGNVITAKNPEAQEMHRRGLPFLSMAEAIKRYVIGERYTIVAAGTHGKTTTTSLAAHVFVELGADPGFLIGGIANNFDSNFRQGSGDLFVIEGDEYDTAYFDKTPKFFKYQPDALIVTSLEFDHADIYADLDAIRSQFSALVGGLPGNGVLVACADDAEAAALSRLAPCEVVTYGVGKEAGCRIDNWRPSGALAEFDTVWDGHRESWAIPLPGLYNARNACAVIVVARGLGHPFPKIREALRTFRGVRRRQEVRGEANGVVVIDDFAHHPTAIKLTIEAIKAHYPGRRVWAIFEPRSFTARGQRFQEAFPTALQDADRVVLAQPYRSDYSSEVAVLDTVAVAKALSAGGTEAVAAESTEDILQLLTTESSPGDVVLIMSNGGFDNIHERLLEALRQSGPLTP